MTESCANIKHFLKKKLNLFHKPNFDIYNLTTLCIMMRVCHEEQH